MISTINGNALSIPLPDNVVQCVITSPPYWGLRDYGVSGQIGLESTPQAYVSNIVAVMRECWRVMRDDATLWMVIGDSYSRQAGDDSTKATDTGMKTGRTGKSAQLFKRGNNVPPPGLKPKDLVGIPWRVAFALQDDGWTLRSDIVWAKPNPMPESVTDRVTKSHEYIFMFSKSKWVGPDRGMFADISDNDSKWLALLLDTEGNICAKRSVAPSGQNHYGTQICFANTNRALIDRTQEIIGHGSIATRKGKNAPMYYLQLTHIQAASLLYRIYPYLIVKQRQARLAIYLQDVIYEGGRERRSKAGQLRGRMRDDSYTAELEKIWATMKDLNHFRNPSIDFVPEPRYGHWDSQRYYYDAEAIKELQTQSTIERAAYGWNGRTDDNSNGARTGSTFKRMAMTGELIGTIPGDGMRNKRSVWTVATSPYSGAHFATFPPALVEPMILVGTSPQACETCGAPWEREIERTAMIIDRSSRTHELGRTRSSGTMLEPATSNTIGWRPTCDCPPELNTGSGKCIVLDPFAGTSTVGRVCAKHGRKFIGVELNPAYIELAEDRTSRVQIALDV